MLLSAKSGARDNNFNLLRFLAAFAVMASHSTVLATGNAGLQLGRRTLGMSPGDIGVDVFFVVSGFLVTGSLFRRPRLGEFICARLLRIYPALLAMILVCVTLLGATLGELPYREFIGSKGTLRFIEKNLVLVQGVQLSLPGVFRLLPWKSVVNGSLWTMTYELRCYLALAAGWGLLAFTGGRRRAILPWVAALVAAVSLAIHLETVRRGVFYPFPRLHLMFATGVLMRALEHRIRLDWRILATLAAVGALCSLDRTAWQFAYPFILPYSALYLAYVPSGPLLGFNRVGDASYGLYIYSFPIQQSVVQLHPGLSPTELTLRTAMVVLPLSFASWHLLESRILDTKPRVANAANSLVDGFLQRIPRRR